LVERRLPKPKVAGSRPVVRFRGFASVRMKALQNVLVWLHRRGAGTWGSPAPRAAPIAYRERWELAVRFGVPMEQVPARRAELRLAAFDHGANCRLP
jgi:hypothetical protein